MQVYSIPKNYLEKYYGEENIKFVVGLTIRKLLKFF